LSIAHIYRHACEQPSKTAVIYNGTAISYAAFANAIDRAMRSFQAEPAIPGTTVVVVIDNLLDCRVAVLALQSLGINTICVKSASILRELRLRDFACIVTTEVEMPDLQGAADPWPLTRVIAIGKPGYEGEELTQPNLLAQAGNIGGHILYTSGTTGNYKKIFWSGELLEQRLAERIKSSSMFSSEAICHFVNFGLWTAVGYRVPLAIWQAGGTVIVDQRSEWHRHFLEHPMTLAVLIPDMINQLLKSMDSQPPVSSAMDFVLMATGGFISRGLAEQIISRITVNLENSYGSTETNLQLLRSTVTQLDDLHWLTPTRKRLVEIVDAEGKPCPIDTEGQLRVRLSELDCSSYMDDPEASQKVFRDGYFYPGDMAVRRADGCIRILGRSADVVNFRGQKLAVAPIEHNIQNLLGVDAVCLFSGVSDAGEAEVVIAIESEEPPERSALMNLGHEFAQFDQVRFALLQRFPRTRTGTSKIDRNALRKLIFPDKR